MKESETEFKKKKKKSQDLPGKEILDNKCIKNDRIT